MAVLTISELEYLSNANSSNVWARNRIKQKIRNSYVLLNTVLQSNRIDEFLPELIPFVNLFMRLVELLPEDIILHEVVKLIEGKAPQDTVESDAND